MKMQKLRGNCPTCGQSLEPVEFYFDRRTCILIVEGKPTRLSPTESAAVDLMLRRYPDPIHFREIHAELNRCRADGGIKPESVQVQMTLLRKKLGIKSGLPLCVSNIFGRGLYGLVRKTRAKLTAAILVLSTVGAAYALTSMSLRAQDMSGANDCMTLVGALRQVNQYAIKATATASKAASFTFNGATVCQGVTTCSYTWLRRNMVAGENRMEMRATDSADSACFAGLIAYVDAQ